MDNNDQSKPAVISENAGTYTFTQPNNNEPVPKAPAATPYKPVPRKIRPRVLKSEYDRLKSNYTAMTYLMSAGWILFFLTLVVLIKVVS